MAVASDAKANGGSPTASGVKKKANKMKQEVGQPNPTWLFSADDKKSKNGDSGTAELAEAIEYLKHKALQTPPKPAPPLELLRMISGFLATYGFQSTNRLFTTEWKARSKVIGWGSPKEVDKSSTDLPDLIHVYNNWHVPSTDVVQPKDETATSEDTSSSGSESSNEDDETSSSASDSDSDSSEDETPQPVQIIERAATKPAEASMTNKLKRKAKSPSTASSKSSKSSSDSSSEASDSDSDRPVKKPKIEVSKIEVAVPIEAGTVLNATKLAGKSSESDSESSSSDSSSENDSSEDDEDADSIPSIVASAAKAEKLPTALTNGKAGRTSSSSSASDARPYFDATDSPKGNAAVAVATTIVKKNGAPLLNQSTEKGGKKTSTPFRRIPEDTKIDPRLSSNAYQSYDYADRAYRDLSVTKGKGFTKEKNKKKRGSYRGGAIDIWGAKGIKFDD